MGFQVDTARGGMPEGVSVASWPPSAAARSLAQEAASWSTSSCDAHRNRQFLVNFAFDLVQLFRSEEVHLRQLRSPLLAWRRRENHRLAQSLRELMRQADQGLDVVSGIRDFLGEWRTHQELSPLRLEPTGLMGH